MSGGHFNYIQNQMNEAADEILEQALSAEDIAARKLLIEAATSIRSAAIYALRFDWYISGDDDAESFTTRLKEDLLK
jgi:hypothetical protein